MTANDSRPLNSSVPFLCIHQFLEHQARRAPDALAILAPGRAPFTYGQLYQHIDDMTRVLRASGIGLHDRVAVVLPNGPEMAVAVLTVASAAACAPINPAYRADEFRKYFAALKPRALITQAGSDVPARRAASSLGVDIIELSILPDAEAGRFTLNGNLTRPPFDEKPSPGDVALLLPTSGTTSHPKIVPLTHARICTSAYAHGTASALTETDRTLNILPLFHGHGIIGTVMTSLAAGASVVCTTGFDANKFFAWLADFHPTWYSAVPTMHQAIVGQARPNCGQAANCRLRFIRSSSAPLPPRVSAELERTFDAPVIEWYGMTEVTGFPVACNPLPPRERKQGSVGVPMGLDVAIMDEQGALLPVRQTGQVVVRGATVFTAYADDPEATHAAFARDWFKTGDLGFFDADGYLFLTGRVREIINRGGEKISPKEVDDVLREHHAVAEVATFPVPHATLGEDVASAVVLRPDTLATPKEIRQFAIGRIAGFKVPRQVIIVSEIPKGPTGKVQRFGLAAKLGLATGGSPRRAFVAPRTSLEKKLAKRWAELLELEQIGIHDDFFALGGDSLLAIHVVDHAYQVTRVELEISEFFEGPTVTEVAERLTRQGKADRPPSTIIRVPRKRGVAPASIAQERLWKLHAALPNIPFGNIIYALRLTSPVDVPVLERSINEIVRRHEMLRTTFAIVKGRYLQVIAPRLEVPLIFEDLHKVRSPKKRSVIQELVKNELTHRFDLVRGPLIRARLVRLTGRTHLLLINLHQMIEDGWSFGVFTGELATLVNAFAAGRPSFLAPLPVQYADFAYWQRRWRSERAIVAQLGYWREQLRKPLPLLRLATARPRRMTDDFYTARRQVTVSGKLSEAAKRFSEREGVTLFITLLTAFKIVLHRYSYEKDMRVASHLANRHRPMTSGLIGPLVNTVILRTSLAGDPTSREVLRRVRTTTLAAFANQDIPFGEVVDILQHEQQLEPATLAQVMMWLQSPALRPTVGFEHGFTFEEIDPGVLRPPVTITTFDIILMLRENADGGLVGTCVYKPVLFGARTIERLLRNFQRVLEHLIRQPELPVSAIRLSLEQRT